MIKTIGFSDFCDEFHGSQYEKNFSYNGKRALFDYLEEYEESTGEKVELDIVALCCDYTEYENFEEVQKNYDKVKTLEELQDNTQVIELENGGLIIQNY